MALFEKYDQYEFGEFSICFSREHSDDDELRDLFDQLSGMDKPEFLGNHLMDVDSEEPQESAIVFADKDPEEHRPPQREANAALANVTEFRGQDTEKFHIHIDIVSEEFLGEFCELLLDITDAVGRLALESLSFQFGSEIPFEQYDLPVDRTSEQDIFGIRYGEGDYNHIFQNDLEYYEEDTTSYRIYSEKDFYVDDSSAENIIETEIRRSLEYLEELEL